MGSFDHEDRLLLLNRTVRGQHRHGSARNPMTPGGGRRVSVIVPAYQAEKTVERVLRSLLDQTMQDIEVIAVNDGSVDSTGEVLHRVARCDTRLRVVQLKENRGVHEARLAGIREATSPWIGFADADDVAHRTMYESLINFCEAHRAEIGICGIRRVTIEQAYVEDKLRFAADSIFDSEVFKLYCQGSFGTGSLCNKVFRRDLLSERVLAPPVWRLNASEDTFLNLGCFLNADRVGVIKDCLYDYTINPGSASQHVSNGRAFSRLLRSYAAAMAAYAGEGGETGSHITGLYRSQLHYDCYWVADEHDLEPVMAETAEALELLARHHPGMLAILLNRMPMPSADTGGPSLGGTVRSIASRMGLLPGLFAAAVLRRLPWRE